MYRFPGSHLPILDSKITHITEFVPEFNIINHAGSISDLLYFTRYSILKKISLNKLQVEKRSKLVKTIKKADLVIVAPLGASIGSYVDRTLLYTLLICSSLNKSILFHLDTINDSKKFVFNFIAEQILRQSNVFVREKQSVRYLKMRGIDSSFGIDTAFMFKNEIQYNEHNYNTLLLSDISSWHINYKKYRWEVNDYIKIIVKPFADFSIANGKRVCILKHAEIDNDFLKKITCYLQDNYVGNIIDNSDIDSPYLYDAIIQNSNFVVTSRYHGVILSEKYSVPFYALAYDSKTVEACEYAGCNDSYDWIENVMNDDHYFLSRLEMINKNYKKIEQKLNTFNTSNIKKTVYNPTEFIKKIQNENDNK